MSKRSNPDLLQDILEAISKIFRYTEGINYETFIQIQIKLTLLLNFNDFNN
jgi:uncharacterized protein with HEPN domain